MPSKLIDPAELPTYSFDWGVIKPLVSDDNVSDPGVSLDARGAAARQGP